MKLSEDRELISAVCAVLGCPEGEENLSSGDARIKLLEPLSAHTTFKCGGPAQLFIEAENDDELSGLLRLFEERKIPYFILGRGSNLLVSDDGFNGAVICLCGDYSGIGICGECMDSSTGESSPDGSGAEAGKTVVEAGAGASLVGLSAFARDNSLDGLAFACGIPGSVGGGIIMNAGAYGGELKDVTLSVDVLDPESLRIFTIPAPEMEFGYRTSRAKKEGLIVLRARFGLEKGDRDAIAGKMEELLLQRRQKQPLEYPSAGSTFKRPEGYFAGKLIQDAGLKGFSVGAAQVSEKHSGFVINRGGASAAEIAELIETVRRKVYENSGVMLEREVIYVGFDGTDK
ncbi:MAG: UDP-N-acetylmuramate dehydrogenase [Lachnospiraceae bacterium]|nr:UDP-N-acetylmuramate dehydrogenase [Lachnospiraceae bacterium]